jgi:argininosuccinate synthase
VREWDLTRARRDGSGPSSTACRFDVTKDSPYSIDDNLWGRAIECGVLEDPWNEPPEDIYTLTVDPEKAPDEPDDRRHQLREGVPVPLDGEKMSLPGSSQDERDLPAATATAAST